VYFSIWKGVKVSGMIARVTVIAPYFLLAILLIKAMTLKGFANGIKYLFVPDLRELLKVKTWYAALD